MRRGAFQTETTSAADEILRCRCRAGESWLADCSRAVVQRLRSSDRRAMCWSVERSTCRCRPIGAGDGRRERQAGSRLQDMLQIVVDERKDLWNR